MRKYILLIAYFGTLSGYSQQSYRYIDKEKEELFFSDNKFFISVKDTNNLEDIRKISFISKLDKIDHKGTYLAVATQKITYSEAFSVLNKDPNIIYFSPIIHSNGKEMGGYTSKIIIKTKAEMSQEKIESLISKYGLSVSEYSEFDKTTVYLRSNEKDALQNQHIANILHESSVFEYADPNYLLFVYPSSDPIYPYQWHLNNTGQVGGSTGEDIKAEGAWDITTGSSSVRIAIMDSGVDLDHEDLEDNLDSGYDATGGSSGGGGFFRTWHGGSRYRCSQRK